MHDLLRFARRYMARYLHWYAAGALALVATNWLAVSIPLYVADGIDAIEAGGDVGPVVARDALVVALMGLGIMVIRTLSRILFFTPGRLVEARLKRDLFERLLRQQPAFLRRWSTGDLVSRASSDVTMVRLLAGFGALQVINAGALVGLTAVQMVRLSPELTLWVAGPVGVGFAVTLGFVQRVFVLIRRLQERLAAVSDHALTSYQGISTIQNFAAEEAFRRAFSERVQAHADTALARARLRVAITPTMVLAASLSVFVLLYVGGPMAIAGELSVGELVAFVTLVTNLTMPLRSTTFLLSVVRQAQAALGRIVEVMDPAPDRPELPHPDPAPEAPPGIRIEHLDFAYPDQPDRMVLRDVSLRVPSGTTLGILGPTGAGKTTLLRCISRLYNPPRGTVLVDGTDVLDLDLDDWRRALTVVPQRTFLFSEPLADNILLGSEDDGRLERVVDLAALAPDLDALPHGLRSPVGESGIMLSGGQRQRTALARGLLRSHVVLALDDVLSSVDHETEHRLVETLRSRAGGPTTLIVSHRISALRHADRVVVLDRGRVVDRGTHEELVARPGLYRDTWERQQDPEEER